MNTGLSLGSFSWNTFLFQGLHKSYSSRYQKFKHYMAAFSAKSSLTNFIQYCTYLSFESKEFFQVIPGFHLCLSWQWATVFPDTLTSKTYILVGYSVVYRLPHVTTFNSPNLFQLPSLLKCLSLFSVLN